MNILVIAAHPDDEVLGMGGTIKKYTAKGDDVKIVFMATGIFSRRTPNYKNSTNYSLNEDTSKRLKVELNDLRKNALKATKILGVKDVEFNDLPDNELDKISNLEITKKIEDLVSRYHPDIVYTHSQNDLNIDHRVLYNATITAIRPTTKNSVKEILCFEVPSSTEWNYPANFVMHNIQRHTHIERHTQRETHTH